MLHGKIPTSRPAPYAVVNSNSNSNTNRNETAIYSTTTKKGEEEDNEEEEEETRRIAQLSNTALENMAHSMMEQSAQLSISLTQQLSTTTSGQNLLHQATHLQTTIPPNITALLQHMTPLLQCCEHYEGEVRQTCTTLQQPIQCIQRTIQRYHQIQVAIQFYQDIQRLEQQVQVQQRVQQQQQQNHSSKRTASLLLSSSSSSSTTTTTPTTTGITVNYGTLCVYVLSGTACYFGALV
jgi:hypothetical protein